MFPYNFVVFIDERLRNISKDWSGGFRWRESLFGPMTPFWVRQTRLDKINRSLIDECVAVIDFADRDMIAICIDYSHGRDSRIGGEPIDDHDSVGRLTFTQNVAL